MEKEIMLEALKSNNVTNEILSIKQITDTNAIKTFEDFKNNSKKVMY